MIALVVAELSAYMTIATQSRIVLDHFESSSDDTLQVNFNLTFPHLKCEYASVDASNFMGTHDAGLAARVSKVRLSKSGKPISRHEDRKKELKHTTDESPHEGPQASIDLKEATFETKHHEFDVMIVNFFAPWCHWCQRLEPVWEKTATKEHTKHPLDTDKTIVLAKVDCTGRDSESLCIKHRIDAFPTIMVFRKDDKGNSFHETYHGERSVDKISEWAENLVAQNKKEIAKTRVTDVDKDGVAESNPGVGCLISGLLHVQRAPGMLKIQAASDSHQFNWETMDVSHTVNHLSYGPFLSETAWAVLPPHIAAVVGSLDDRKYVADAHVPTTMEHTIKVVRHEVTPPSKWKLDPVVSYGYTAHSNKIQKEGEVPTVRLNYDILPVVVQYGEKSKSFYTFLTSLCAIVGGVFTTVGMLASLMDKTALVLKQKEELGKLG